MPRAWPPSLTILIDCREEKRCRVREKELREKDILIQDNLIRFSSFLQHQQTRRLKEENLAKDERIVSQSILPLSPE